MSLRILSWALCGQFLVASAQAEDQADVALRWLNRMAQSAASLSYDGTFIYIHQGAVETMRIVHKAEGNDSLERLVSLNGSMREVVRQRNKVTCFLPNNKQVVVEQNHGWAPFLASLPGRIGKVRGYYALQMGDVDRVAGLRAQEIHVTPRDQYRFGYRLWLDARNGMLLKSQMMNENAQPVEQIIFTNVSLLTTVPDRMLEPEGVQAAPSAWITDEKQSPSTDDGLAAWRVAWMPEGFEIAARHTRNSTMNSSPILHYLLSDGFASISVFIERHGSRDNLTDAEVKKGAISAYSTFAGDYKVTTVGEVPIATVRRIAQSVRMDDSAGKAAMP